MTLPISNNKDNKMRPKDPYVQVCTAKSSSISIMKLSFNPLLKLRMSFYLLTRNLSGISTFDYLYATFSFTHSRTISVTVYLVMI